MDLAQAARLRAWLGTGTVRRVNASVAETLHRATEDPLRLAELVQVLPHGTSVCFAPTLVRRVFEFDRGGVLLSALSWHPGGALAAACVRIPDGSWVAVEPRATADAPWGLSDRVWHVAEPSTDVPWRAGTPLTHFAAIDYARIDVIPPLAEPSRLPGGAGTAILNLIASLARDQGAGRLAYRGPYPTEQLFLALLESFRCEGSAADPLARFMTGGLAWRPAPHERLFHPRGPYVQLRDRVEKVVAEGRVYTRPDWSGTRRRAPRRVSDGADGVHCALWFLETAIEEHFLLSAAGDVLRVIDPAADDPRRQPIPRAVWDGIAASVAVTSAPALAPFVRLAAAPMAAEWGPVGGDLVTFEGERAWFSHRIRAALAERLGALGTPADRLGLALAALRELAGLVGDELRARAEARLAALQPGEQAAALGAHTATGPEDREAREIAAATDALARDLVE